MRTMFPASPEGVSEFVAEINRLDQSKRDFVTDTSLLRFSTSETDSTLAVEGEFDPTPVNETAHQQIAARLSIPKPYYDRMRRESPALLDANVMTWLHEQPQRRMVRVLDGKVRAYLSDRYARIDHINVLRAISEPLAQLQAERGAKIVSSAITETKMYVKVVLPGIEDEITVGDIVQSGFVISNSETGHGAFSIEQMIYTLVCSNGMIAGKSLSRRHVGARISDDEVYSDRTRQLDDQTLLSAAKDIVAAAVDQSRFNALCARLREAVSTAPSIDPVKTCERLAKTHDLTEGEQGLVLSSFVSDAGHNGLGLYGLLNAVTRTSQTVSDYDRATELERLGGKLLLDTSPKEWLHLSAVAA